MRFALAKAAETNFDMQWFGAISLYEPAWRGGKKRVRDVEAQQRAIADCRFCNEHGFLEFVDGAVCPCPHDAERIALVHQQKPIRDFHHA